MPNSKLQCTGCKGRYRRETMIKLPVGNFCSDNCAYIYARRKVDAHQQKHERKVLRERKAAIETRGQVLKKTQAAFNAYIRERDRGRPCVSCGRPDDGTHQRHASHYRSRGAHPELALNELNCHASCAQCNNFLSGNLTPYREELVKRIGPKMVEWLEGPHEPVKYTIEQLRGIATMYRAKVRELRKHDHQTT